MRVSNDAVESGTFSVRQYFVATCCFCACRASGGLRSIRDALLPGEVALLFQLLLARRVTTDTSHSDVGEFVWMPEPSRSGWGMSPYAATRGPRSSRPAANLKILQTADGLDVLSHFSGVYRTIPTVTEETSVAA
jgi:hypothetical protein